MRFRGLVTAILALAVMGMIVLTLFVLTALTAPMLAPTLPQGASGTRVAGDRKI